MDEIFHLCQNIFTQIMARKRGRNTINSRAAFKHRMSYIFFIRNSGERKGKYKYYRTQLFPAYASEQNLKRTSAILGEKDPKAVVEIEMLPQKEKS